MSSLPSILFLHAISRSSADFGSFAKKVDTEFNAIVPDLLGHGQQRRAEKYQLTDYRDAVLDDLPTEGDFILWGHSLGGLVSLALAEKLGPRVSAIILEDVPLFEVDWPRFRDGPFFEGFKFLYDQLSDLDLQSEVLKGHVTGWPSGYGDSTIEGYFGPRIVEQRTAALLALDPKALRPPMVGELFSGVNIRQILRAVHCPIHLLAGNRENGSALTEGDLDAFSELCPNSSVHRFEALGHDIRLFDETACLAILNSLLPMS